MNISKKPISKETLDYVLWLTQWMWCKCTDTKTREVLKEEIERAKMLHSLNVEYNLSENEKTPNAKSDDVNPNQLSILDFEE